MPFHGPGPSRELLHMLPLLAAVGGGDTGKANRPQRLRNAGPRLSLWARPLGSSSLCQGLPGLSRVTMTDNLSELQLPLLAKEIITARPGLWR